MQKIIVALVVSLNLFATTSVEGKDSQPTGSQNKPPKIYIDGYFTNKVSYTHDLPNRQLVFTFLVADEASVQCVTKDKNLAPCPAPMKRAVFPKESPGGSHKPGNDPIVIHDILPANYIVSAELLKPGHEEPVTAKSSTRNVSIKPGERMVETFVLTDVSTKKVVKSVRIGFHGFKLRPFQDSPSD